MIEEEDEVPETLHITEAESERDFLQKFGDAVMNDLDLRDVSGMIDELDGVSVYGEKIMECMVSSDRMGVEVGAGGDAEMKEIL